MASRKASLTWLKRGLADAEAKGHTELAEMLRRKIAQCEIDNRNRRLERAATKFMGSH